MHRPASAARRWRVMLLVPIVVLMASRSSYAEASTQPGAARSVPWFEFHSSFWMNLHQTLSREAALRRVPAAQRMTPGPIPIPQESLSESEKVAWQTAVEFYDHTFRSRSLLFDSELVEINDALAAMPDDGMAMDSSRLPSALVQVLLRVGPLYRAHWWEDHDRKNREWLATMEPRLDSFGLAIAVRLERNFQSSWPAKPLRVDLVYYTSERGGAYTTDHPPHTTFATNRLENQGLSGFQILFHEASHELSDRLERTLDAECSAQEKDCGELWHAALDLAAVDAVRHALAGEEGVDTSHLGIYESGPWIRFRAPLEHAWQAYLDGKIDFQAAVKSMVAAL